MSNYLLVAAIDFGTTYSGYVFTFVDQPSKFISPIKWTEGVKCVSQKIPTCLLLNSDLSFKSFGIEAEEQYAALSEDGKHTEYYLFQRFKMELHTKNIRKDTNLYDVTKKPAQAIKIFSLSIKYLKDHLLEVIKKQCGTQWEKKIPPTAIKYVLTVPAIWSDRSKRFMRDAAVEAGIPNNQLVLALEPEAASIYCQRESDENMLFTIGKEITNTGSRYLVADLGGGTADFSVHEVEEDGSLLEIHRASGGPYGGDNVNREYLKIYNKIFGEGTIDQLQKEDMVDYLEITRSFEALKRKVTTNYDSNTPITLPPFFTNMIPGAKDKIQCPYLKDNIVLRNQRLRLSAGLMKSFFNDSIEKIVGHVQTILQSVQNVKTILLVGGYGDCALVQDRFKNEFSNKDIIIPQECDMVVMKGAVWYGLRPLSISARLLRFSYGDVVHTQYDPKIHPEEKRYLDNNGIERCRHAFRMLICKNTKVPSTGKTIEMRAKPVYDTDKSYLTRVYCTEKENPVVVDESCQLVGELKVTVPDHITGKWEAEEEFVFGMTEVKVSAKVIATDEIFETTLDLLE